MIKVTCQCGASFSAKDSLAGKKVKCPKCGNPLSIPAPQLETIDPLVGQTPPSDPLGSVSPDPLGIGSIGDDVFGTMEPVPAASLPSATMPASTMPARTQIPQTGRTRVSNQPVPTGLEIATGIVCILHGLLVAPISGFSLLGLLAVSSEMIADGFGISFGITLLLTAIVFGLGVSFLASGIGLLVKQDWALQIGVPASYIHFCIMALGAVMMIISLVRIAAIGIQISLVGFFVYLISAALFAVGPALLLKLNNEDEHY